MSLLLGGHSRSLLLASCGASKANPRQATLRQAFCSASAANESHANFLKGLRKRREDHSPVRGKLDYRFDTVEKNVQVPLCLDKWRFSWEQRRRVERHIE